MGGGGWGTYAVAPSFLLLLRLDLRALAASSDCLCSLERCARRRSYSALSVRACREGLS